MSRFAVLLIVALCSVTGIAAGNESVYPSKPIKLIIPNQVGGVADALARLLDRPLQSKIGHPLIIEAKPGGANTVALEALRQSPADGYTLFLGSAELTMLPSLKRSFKSDPAKDFTNIASFASFSTIFALNKSFPAQTLPELIAYAKANPGKIRYGSGGVGGSLHLVSELLGKTAGIDIVHVPYKSGTNALTDAIAGHIEMASVGIPNGPTAQAAGLRIVAQTGATRNALFPDVPTTAEVGLPQVQMIMWFSLVAPSNTPDAVVQKLSGALREITQDPEYQAQLGKLGASALWLSPAGLQERMAEDRAKWHRVISEAGIESVD